MSLQTRLGALITAIGADIKALQVAQLTSPALAPARAYRNAAKTWSAGATTKVELDTRTGSGSAFDPGGNFNVAGADGTATKGRFTAPQTGYYQINANVSFTASASGQYAVAVVWRNGTLAIGTGSMGVSSAAAQSITSEYADIVYLTAGQYLELFAYCNAAISLSTGIQTNFLSAALVGQAQVINNKGLIGSPTAWLTADIPTGYLEFNGQAITLANYPILYGLFGGTLPDLRNKFLLGDSASHAIATTGGEETHTLTSGESGMPGHNTGGMSAGNPHAHSVQSMMGWGAGSYALPYWDGNSSRAIYGGSTVTATTSADIAHTHAVGAVGAANAHNNMPPYRTVKWITIAG